MRHGGGTYYPYIVSSGYPEITLSEHTDLLKGPGIVSAGNRRNMICNSVS